MELEWGVGVGGVSHKESATRSDGSLRLRERRLLDGHPENPFFSFFIPFGQDQDVKTMVVGGGLVGGGGGPSLHRHDCFHSERGLFQSHTLCDSEAFKSLDRLPKNSWNLRDAIVIMA